MHDVYKIILKQLRKNVHTAIYRKRADNKVDEAFEMYVKIQRM